MGINPISELSGQFSATTSTKKTEGTDFQSFMEDASTKSKMNDPYMDNLPVASTSDTKYENVATESQDDSQTKVNNDSDSLSTDHTDVKKVDVETIKELKDKIIDEAAKELGVSVEDIVNVLSQLGIGAADLLNTENVSLLVANVVSDGDVMGLLIDENAANAVLELGHTIENMVVDIAESEEVAPEFIKDLVITNEPDTTLDALENINNMVDQAKITAWQSENVEMENETSNQQETLDNEGNNTGIEKRVNEEGGSRESIAELVINSTNNSIETSVDVTEVKEVITESSQIDTIDVINQIQEHVKAEFKDDMTELQMQLNPENLGTVNLTVAAKESGVTAQLITQNESVQMALESQVALLRESLEQQGVKVEAIEVMVGSHGFEQNLEQGNDFNEQQEEENDRLRRATRKIDLGSFAGDGDIEEIDPSEQITVEMMQADGNQMDYKV